MFWSEINNTLLLIDRLSPIPRLFIQSNKYYHTKIGLITSLCLLICYSVLITYFIVEFFKGSGVVVIYSKDTSDNMFYYNMTDKLFAFNLSSSTKGYIDPRAVEIKVYYWEYHGANTSSAVEVEIEQCDFHKHFKEGTYSDAYKNLDMNNFYCLNTNKNDFSLFYSPKEWSGSYLVVYVKTCSNTSENEDFCYTQDIIDQYMKQDNFFFTFIVDNVDINHYNKSHPMKIVKYYHSLKLSYSSRSDIKIYWRQVDYLTDKGWIFDKISTITSYQLDQTLNQQVVTSNEEPCFLDNTFSTIQFQLYYATIDRYKRTYPKLQTVLASISGIVQVMFYICNFIVYVSSVGQYYCSFINIFSSELPKEDKSKSVIHAHNLSLGSDVSGSHVQFNTGTPSKTEIIHIHNMMKERKSVFKLQVHPNTKEKDVSVKSKKAVKAKGISCLKSFLWYFSSGNKKGSSTISIIEKFVRNQLSVEKIICRLSKNQKKIHKTIGCQKTKITDYKDCYLSNNPSNGYYNCNSFSGISPKRDNDYKNYKGIPLSKPLIKFQTLSERPNVTKDFMNSIMNGEN